MRCSIRNFVQAYKLCQLLKMMLQSPSQVTFPDRFDQPIQYEKLLRSIHRIFGQLPILSKLEWETQFGSATSKISVFGGYLSSLPTPESTWILECCCNLGPCESSQICWKRLDCTWNTQQAQQKITSAPKLFPPGSSAFAHCHQDDPTATWMTTVKIHYTSSLNLKND